MTGGGIRVDRLVGAVLDDKYEIVRLVGEGGMGAVYEARHRLIGRRLAVKVLHPEIARDLSIVQRFCNEARIAGSLGHENIIEVTDLGQLRSGLPYIVMEFLEGQSLGERIHDAGPLPIEEAVEIVAHVLDALVVVHHAGVVHRDLKPDNVFLAARGTRAGRRRSVVKVLDFGISKLRTPGGEAQKLTQTGSVLGTPHYMSPEQAEGRQDLDHRTDIYATGAILYEALTAHTPFEGDSFAAVIAAIVTRRPVPPSAHCAGIPHALDEIALKALAREPADRFSSADEFLAAIEPFRPENLSSPGISVESLSAMAATAALAPSRGKTAATAPATAGTVTARAPRPRWGVIAAAASGGMLLAAVLFVLFGRGAAGGGGTPDAGGGLPGPMSYVLSPSVGDRGTADAEPIAEPSVENAAADAAATVSPLVRLAFEGVPEGGKLSIGSLQITAPPYEIVLEVSNRPLPVLVEAPGFKTYRAAVAPDRDRVVSVQMDAFPSAASVPDPADAGRVADDSGGRRTGDAGTPDASGPGVSVRPVAADADPAVDSAAVRRQVRSRLESLQVAVATCVGNRAGTVRCSVSVDGSTGRAAAIDVMTQIQSAGAAACVRTALGDVPYPRFEGPPIDVSYTYRIGEAP